MPLLERRLDSELARLLKPALAHASPGCAASLALVVDARNRQIRRGAAYDNVERALMSVRDDQMAARRGFEVLRNRQLDRLRAA
jgi:hypothetical protein